MAPRGKKAKPRRKRAPAVVKVDSKGRLRDSRGRFIPRPKRKTPVERVERAIDRELVGEATTTILEGKGAVAWSLVVELPEAIAPTEAVDLLAALARRRDVALGFVAAGQPAMVLVALEDEEGRPLGWRSASSTVSGHAAIGQALDWLENYLPLKTGNYTSNPFVSALELRLMR